MAVIEVKRILILFCMTTLLLINISISESDSVVISYDKNDKVALFDNAFGERIGTAELITPKINYVMAGKDRKVMIFEIENKGVLYKDGLKKLEITNMKSNKLEDKSYYLMYAKNISYTIAPHWREICFDELTLEKYENGTINRKCTLENYENQSIENVIWANYTNTDIPSGKIRIAIVTDVRSEDYYDGIPILYRKRIDKWAVWIDSMNIGLVAYYNFDEGNGTKVIDVVNGTANGTLYGSAHWDTGKIGQAFHTFPTPSSYVSISNITKINNFFDKTLMPHTLAWWVYKNDTSYPQSFFNKGVDGIENTFFQHGGANNKCTFIQSHNTNTQQRYWEVLNCIPDNAPNQWVFMVLTWDGNNRAVSDMHFYVNNISTDIVVNGDNLAEDLDTSNSSFNISGENYVFLKQMSGYFDEMGLWDRRLSEAEISDLYNNGIGITYKPTVTDIIHPTWKENWTSAAIQTKKGDLVYFNVTLEDDLEGGNWIFSFFNGSIWQNNSGNWTGANHTVLNETKIITAIKNQVIQWKWYFSDAVGNKNETPVWSFIVVNSPPNQTHPLLKTPSGKNLSYENLTCYNQSTYDADGDLVTNIFNWYKNNQHFLALNLPFETNTNDYSDNNNYGTKYGNPNYINGKYGKSLEFDGINDYILIPDSNSLDFTNKKTWQLWFKRATIGAKNLFNKGDAYRNYKMEFLSNNLLKFSYSLLPGWINYLWQVKTKDNFDEGIYNLTYYNNTENAVMLDNSYSGYYKSRIFNDSEKTLSFNTINWNADVPVFEELSVEEGMVGLWHMNENSGTIAYDETNNNNDGTIYGAGWTTGKFNSALSFDGDYDYISTSRNNFPTGNGNITIEAWFKIDDLNGDNSIVTYGKNSGNNAIQLFHRTSDDKLVLHYWGGYGAVTTPLNDNDWHYVAAIHTNNTNYLYLNGELKSSTAYSNANIINEFNEIGRVVGYPSYDFDGIIDEIAIYDRALSENEIQEHYEKGSVSTNISLSVRSCDDAICSGESWTNIGNTSPQDLDIPNNTYFQFKAYFTSNSTNYSSKLYNVTLNYSAQITETEANITSITAITDNNWHLATITFDNDEQINNLKIYLDNSTEPNAQKTEHSLPYYKDNNLTIAKFFNGSIDEFKIYNETLTQEQIQAHYNLEYNTIVSQETSGGDNWMCQVTPNDAEEDGETKDSNNLTVLHAITFNVTYGEDGSQETNFNIDCDNGFSVGGVNSPVTYGFEPSSYVCIFTKTERYDRTITFTADDDKIVNVKLSRERQLTIEEHTWLEAIYNCIILGDCSLYNLLLQMNQTVGNIWEHTKPTDTSVITFENVTNKVVDSTHNLTINYTVSIPIKAGYVSGTYLPARIGFWFLDANNVTCHNQGSKPTGVEDPYCQPLVIETIGPMGGSVSFIVKLHPSLPAGSYSIKRMIDIDPNRVWINYGQETIGMISLTEPLNDPGISLEKTGEVMPSTPTPTSSNAGSGGSSSVTYNTYITKSGESEKEKSNIEIDKDSSDRGGDNQLNKETENANAGITGGVIGSRILSEGGIITVIAILCGTFIIFMIVRYKIGINSKKKQR